MTTKQNDHEDPKYDIHHDVVSTLHFWWSGWPRVSCLSKFVTIFYFVILFGFFIEGSLFLLVLGLIIPLGFVLRLIKNHLLIAWVVLVIFLNLGGIADLGADIIILVKTLIAYISREMDVPTDELERYLLAARLIMTIVGSVPILLGYFFFLHYIGRMEYELKGETVPKQESSSSTGGMSMTLFVFVGAMVWKLVLIFLRIINIVRILYCSIKYKKLTRKTEYKMAIFEIFLLLDLLWTGIPLGVLTALELFYFKPIHFSSSPPAVDAYFVYEVMKLIALVIDIIAISYLFFFEIVGIGHKSHPKTMNDEEKPLIV